MIKWLKKWFTLPEQSNNNTCDCGFQAKNKRGLAIHKGRVHGKEN